MPTAEFGDFTQTEARDELVAVVVDWVRENLPEHEVLTMSKTEAHLIATRIIVDGYVHATVDNDDALWCLYARSIIEKSKAGHRDRAQALITQVQRLAWRELRGLRAAA